jgi:hypothetical protein
MTSKTRTLFYRFGPSVILVLGFAALTLLHHVNLNLYYDFQQGTDHSADYTPFVDMQAILQAESCWQQGVNVYVANACMDGGYFNYSPFLLWLVHLPLSGADTAPVALLTDFLLIASLSLLPPAKSETESAFRLIVIISPATLYALERANLDVTIFAFSMLACYLLGKKPLLRVAGYALIVLLALAKFYPVFALVSIIRERRRVFLLTAAGCLIILLLGFFAFKSQAISAISIIPIGWPFDGQFGSANIPYGIRVLRAPGDFFGGPRVFHYDFTWFDFGVFMVLRLIALIIFISSIRHYRHNVPAIQNPAMTLFTVGGAIIIGCFFTAQSGNYREIFFIFTLPALWLIAKTSPPAAQAHLALLIIGVVFTVWQPFLNGVLFAFLGLFVSFPALNFPKFIFWLFRELLFWWIMIQFAAILAAAALPQLARFYRPTAAQT